MGEMEDLIKKVKVAQQITQKEIVNNGISFCLLDGADCSEKIIKAHSIQNKNMLAQISDESNHVYAVSHDKDKMFEKKSVNKASTFKGLCGFHDNSIFEYIDNDLYSKLESDKANFLYAFRAISRELYAKKNVIHKYEALFNKFDTNDIAFLRKKFPIFNNDDLRSAFGRDSFFRSMIYGNKIAVKELEKTFDRLVTSYKKCQYDVLKTKVIKVRDKKNITVSSFFAPEFNSKGDQINDIENLESPLKSVFLTVIPDENSSYILISYLKKDAKFLKPFTKDLMNLSADDTKIYLERILLTHCENMYFSEEFINSLDVDQKSRLHTYFLGSTIDMNLAEGYSVEKNEIFGMFI
jgi:hypothetical protein